jgi:hypothetical protein
MILTVCNSKSICEDFVDGVKWKKIKNKILRRSDSVSFISLDGISCQQWDDMRVLGKSSNVVAKPTYFTFSVESRKNKKIFLWKCITIFFANSKLKFVRFIQLDQLLRTWHGIWMKK